MSNLDHTINRHLKRHTGQTFLLSINTYAPLITLAYTLHITKHKNSISQPLKSHNLNLITSHTTAHTFQFLSPMTSRHVILITFPAQGHINPSLQFAKRLTSIGIHVTFATTLHARRRMAEAAAPKGVTFEEFSDGYDGGFKHSTDDPNKYMIEMKSRGTKFLNDFIVKSAELGRPVTCLVYTLLIPWVAYVARVHHLPCALLWIQPATVLNMYYYYFNGYEEEIKENWNDPNWRIRFPGLILSLSKRDLPSFLLPPGSEQYPFVLQSFKEQIEALDAETRAKVLVNTFDALEADALKSIEKYELIGIGPLIPSAFLDGVDPSDKSFGGDLFKKSDDYIEWLDSKPKSSVVYISFGSILRLPKAQMEEIAKGLLECNMPFLWVIRVNEEEKVEDEKLSCMDELEKVGKIVPWCSQLEVLTHPALGCFVTHCGWNSTLESVTCGVPVVAFPQWTDQCTNAKLIEDVWRTGVRVNVNDDGVVESGEIRMCIESVMDGGEISMELRENAKKLKGLAREAAKEVEGSSCKNLKAFFFEVGN